jgi:hypothetical protein
VWYEDEEQQVLLVTPLTHALLEVLTGRWPFV